MDTLFKFGPYSVITDEPVNSKNYDEMKQKAFRAVCAVKVVHDADPDGAAGANIDAEWDTGLMAKYGSPSSKYQQAAKSGDIDRFMTEFAQLRNDIKADVRHGYYINKIPNSVLTEIVSNYYSALDTFDDVVSRYLDDNPELADEGRILRHDVNTIRTNWKLDSVPATVTDMPMINPHMKYKVAYDKGKLAPYSADEFVTAAYSAKKAKDNGDDDTYGNFYNALFASVEGVKKELDHFTSLGQKYIISKGMDGNDAKQFIESKYAPLVNALKVNGLTDLYKDLKSSVDQLAAAWNTPKINYNQTYFGR
jgi:hypothetical protein